MSRYVTTVFCKSYVGADDYAQQMVGCAPSPSPASVLFICGERRVKYQIFPETSVNIPETFGLQVNTDICVLIPQQ